jgi:protein PhnA
MDSKDSNGIALNQGDNVRVTKDLKVKGTSRTLKRGDVIKNIKLTNNPDEIEVRIGKATIVIKKA